MAKKKSLITIDRLVKLPAEQLVRLVYEQTERDDLFAKEVEMLLLADSPSELYSALSKRVSALNRHRRMVSYRESFEMAQKLDRLIEDTKSLLGAVDPVRARDLLERFIATDERILNACDDSGGVVGDVYCRAVLAWGELLGRCPADSKLLDRLDRMVRDDSFGIRGMMIEVAADVVGQEGLIALYEGFERDLAPQDDPSYRFQSLRVLMGQAARALKDGDRYLRSIQIASPEPNGMQALDIATVYLEAGEHPKAVVWLEPICDVRLMDQRAKALLEAYTHLKQFDRIAELARHTFEVTLVPKWFHLYCQSVEPSKAERYRAQTLEAIQKRSLISAVELLFSIDEALAAGMIVTRADEIDPNMMSYRLNHWIKHLSDVYPLAKVVLYRAAALEILDRADSTRYQTAVKYLSRAHALELEVDDWYGIMGPEAFMKSLRQKHGLKYRFWERMEA